MTDRHTVEAYGLRFTTDAWASYTWRQIWTTAFGLAAVACFVGAGAAMVVGMLPLPLQPAENSQQVAYAVGYLGLSVILSAVAFSLGKIGIRFYPNPWHYSLGIEEHLEIESQEVDGQ